MTGVRMGPPARSAPGTGSTAAKYNLWAWHHNVRRWLLIVDGLSGQAAVQELTIRQDIVRRRKEWCRLIVLEDGQYPDEPTP